MDFLGIGPLELVFIVIIMLLILGPQDTVKSWRKMGEMIRKLINHPMFRQVQDARKDLSKLGDKILEETGAEDIRQSVSSEIQKVKEATTFEIHSPKPKKPAAKKESSPPQEESEFSAWVTPATPVKKPSPDPAAKTTQSESPAPPPGDKK